MSISGIIGGVLGILISLVCQFFAIIDDSYTFGNMGLLGIISGVLAITGALLMEHNKNKYVAIGLLLISCITGIISISYFYILPAILTFISAFYLAITSIVKQKGS